MVVSGEGRTAARGKRFGFYSFLMCWLAGIRTPDPNAGQGHQAESGVSVQDSNVGG